MVKAKVNFSPKFLNFITSAFQTLDIKLTYQCSVPMRRSIAPGFPLSGTVCERPLWRICFSRLAVDVIRHLSPSVCVQPSVLIWKYNVSTYCKEKQLLQHPTRKLTVSESSQVQCQQCSTETIFDLLIPNSKNLLGINTEFLCLQWWVLIKKT